MDYKSINTAVAPFITVNNANAYTGKHLFNGNISSMVVNIPKLGEAKVYQYGYDQLQRLLAVDVFEGLNNSNNTFTPVAMNDYKERLNYSANGNIQTYLRNGTGSTMNLNNYNYTYTSGTNRLASIANSVNGQTKTYSYDAIGNTTADGTQGTTNILWNVYGKVQSLTNAQGQSVSYTYDAGGNRISKTVAGVTEWYVRDATGNNMATYTKNSAINSGNLTMTELYKYGSSLLSINTRQVNVEQPVTGEITTMQRGYDGYILSDHLGNTRAVITDRKLQHSSNGTTVDYYIADIKSATYYSAYGAAAKSYNQQPVVAFNGQRKSNEIGNDAQTALFWEYNGDVGRRWNIDPVPKSMVSPYLCFGGNPMLFVDPLGNDWYHNRKTHNTEWFDTRREARQAGYKQHKGVNFWMSSDKKGLQTYYGNSKEQVWQFKEMDNVTLAPTKAKGNSLLSRSQFGRNLQWSVNRGKELQPLQDIYDSRKINGQSLKQDGDSHNYLNNFSELETKYKVRNAFKEGGRDAAIFFLTPFAGMLAVESGAAYYLTMGLNYSITARISIAGFDATYQLMTTGTWNPVQTLSSQLGPLTYALGSSTTWDWSHLQSPVGWKKSATPRNILIMTVFNMAAAHGSAKFDAAGAGPAAGVYGGLPSVWSDGVIMLLNQ